MSNNVLAYRIAEIHNSLAQMATGGVDFKNADNIILFGNAMNEMRTLVNELSKETAAPMEQVEMEVVEEPNV